MKGKTHVIGGVTLGLTVVHLTDLDPVVVLASSIVGSLIPDICHSGSKIGKRMPILSRIINFVFGHRSFTHSIVFCFVIAFLADFLFSNTAIKTGLLSGIISHYILDMATKSGIQLFFPLNFKVRFPLTTRTGSFVENIIFSILSLISFYLGFQVLSTNFSSFINNLTP